MVPATPRVLARMVTPRRYLDPGYLGGSRAHPVRRQRPDRPGRGSSALLHAATRVGSGAGYLYQLAAGAGLDQPAVPAAAAPADPGHGRATTTRSSRWSTPGSCAVLIPNARLHVYHGGHLELVTEAAELAPVIGEFLARRAACRESNMSHGRRRLLRAGAAARPDERALLHRVREFMEKEVAPVINRYWTREEFPHELIPGLRGLGIAGPALHRVRLPGRRQPAGRDDRDGAGPDRLVHRHVLRACTAAWPWARSTCAGREEQKQRWLPAMARMEKIGAFGLTEPDVGSGAAGGLTTTARRRRRRAWVLDGQKKWIGNATFADLVVIWARDVEDDQVKGFVVEKGTPGFSTTKMRRQDRAAGRAERRDHPGRRPGAGGRTGCRTRTRSGTPPRCCG